MLLLLERDGSNRVRRSGVYTVGWNSGDNTMRVGDKVMRLGDNTLRTADNPMAAEIMQCGVELALYTLTRYRCIPVFGASQ